MFSDIPDCTAWTQFIRDIGMYDNQVVPGRISASWQVLKLVRDVFIPFGVPRGSDMQVRCINLRDTHPKSTRSSTYVLYANTHPLFSAAFPDPQMIKDAMHKPPHV